VPTLFAPANPRILADGVLAEGFAQQIIILMCGGLKPTACMLSRIFIRSLKGNPKSINSRHPCQALVVWAVARKAFLSWALPAFPPIP
jgi:hypothetical protein